MLQKLRPHALLRALIILVHLHLRFSRLPLDELLRRHLRLLLPVLLILVRPVEQRVQFLNVAFDLGLVPLHPVSRQPHVMRVQAAGEVVAGICGLWCVDVLGGALAARGLLCRPRLRAREW